MIAFRLLLVQQPAAVGAAGEAWKEGDDNMEEIMNKRAAGSHWNKVDL